MGGTMAIAAGFLAQVSADIQGEIGPFQLAILLTVVALVLVSVMWTENYGEEKKEENTSSTWRVVSDKRIMLVAASTSLFEGSMYTYVHPGLRSGSSASACLRTLAPFLATRRRSDAMVVVMRFSPDRSSRKIGGTCFKSITAWLF